jgi:Ca2+/H+ antiporter
VSLKKHDHAHLNHTSLLANLMTQGVPKSLTRSDLAFPAGLVLMVLLSVLVTGQVAGDGRSDWLKGAQLLAVYLILGLTYFFMPDVSSQ